MKGLKWEVIACQALPCLSFSTLFTVEFACQVVTNIKKMRQVQTRQRQSYDNDYDRTITILSVRLSAFSSLPRSFFSFPLSLSIDESVVAVVASMKPTFLVGKAGSRKLKEALRSVSNMCRCNMIRDLGKQ
jgi:hypothetical protein